MDFGSLQINMDRNTTEGSPGPFVIQNNGNVHVNISLYANSPLWISASAPLGTRYFRFMAGNITGPSFAWNASQTVWANISASQKPLLSRLNYTGNNSAAAHIGITVPPDEPPGSKISVIVFEAEYSG